MYVKDRLFDPNCHLDMSHAQFNVPLPLPRSPFPLSPSNFEGIRTIVFTVPYEDCGVARFTSVLTPISSPLTLWCG